MRLVRGQVSGARKRFTLWCGHTFPLLYVSVGVVNPSERPCHTILQLVTGPQVRRRCDCVEKVRGSPNLSHVPESCTAAR